MPASSVRRTVSSGVWEFVGEVMSWAESGSLGGWVDMVEVVCGG